MSAYQNAIRQLVRPGDVVLDLGAGLGILSYHACAAGAARVYAVEPADIVRLVPRIAAANGLQDRVIVQQRSSFDVQTPELADVMLASMIDGFGIDNNVLGIVIEARGRLLKPGGAVIPGGLRMGYCPVELPEWYRTHIDCWEENRLGFSFREARSIAVNNLSSVQVKRESLLTAPHYFETIRLAVVESANVAAKGVFPIERAGVMHALAGWCEFEMAKGIQVSNSPLDANRMSWANCVLPVERPVAVGPGDTVEASIRAVTIHRGMTWVWDVLVRDSAGALRAGFHHSTFHGLLLSPKELVNRTSGFVPSLSERGMAQMAALELCNGQSSLGEIAETIRSRFPALFASQAAAQDFAASLLNE
jgi:hypothetical protein